MKGWEGSMYNTHKVSIIIISLAIIISNYSIIMSDPIGEVLIGGNTWCEMQWGHSNVDDMIVLDTLDNTIHIVWTYAPPPPYELFRISYYNSYNPQEGWFAHEPGYDMFPGFTGQINHTIMLANDIGGRDGLEIGLHRQGFSKHRVWWADEHFVWEELDSLLPLEYTVRTASGRNGIVQMVGFVGGPLPENYLLLYYGKYNVDPYGFMGWYPIDTLTHITYSIATSPVTNRVAFSYLRQKNFEGHPNSFSTDQDVYFLHSPDGFQWDWDNKIDITHFSIEDNFRPFFDNDIIIDYSDQIHIAFTTVETRIVPDFPESTYVNPFMSFIWHWSEETDSFSVAAYGWETEYFSLGVWKTPVDRPQLAINPNNDYLYLLYERHSPDDISVSDYPNTDLWISVSVDNGLNWSVGTNITDTQTPDCLPGFCQSEIQASINEIVNDTLHIVYMLDKDAGILSMNEGGLLESKVVYQKIPVALIPIEPLLTQFSIRDYPPTGIVDFPPEDLPSKSYLLQNYPNPFNTSTKIEYSISGNADSDISIAIEIYNLKGQKIDEISIPREILQGSILWDASEFSSGIYFARLGGVQSSNVVKLVLMK
ncbi:MAG: T9SS type A sorting domain-containing protein [candidate division Zixibacteria bacterium]|nr:T9SS type A sorting domain-containing protein [candidate division Zixibacteria bacterium]